MSEQLSKDGISVIMPTYNQAAFIRRAIESLKLQTFQRWELLIINDGCTDSTEEVTRSFLLDYRIKYIANSENLGLGACLNIGISNSSYDLIAYLPSDDVYFKDHLQSLFEELARNSEAILAYSGVRYYYLDTPKTSGSRFAEGQIEGFTVQLVQVLHRKTIDRWLEREELVTDDLYRMFWEKLDAQGECVQTKQITCEWTFHPNQRHRILLEEYGGGIFKYKAYYKVKKLLRYHTSTGNLIDENTHFEQFRNEKTGLSTTGLKILLVGELAYNAERITALEEKGHQLYGLWLTKPECYNTIGPLPFGHVEDIPLNNWKQRVEEIQPDIIYALLNYQAVPLAHEVLCSQLNIPFVWHFKEGPFYCRQQGTFEKLIDLYTLADGKIYLNSEVKGWFEQFIEVENNSLSFILDGDLPSKKWLGQERSPLLSDQDGEIHTVAPGRLMGLYPAHIKEMMEQKIHLHFYGNFHHTMYPAWIDEAKKIAPEHFHLHANCTQEDWVKEFSQYDAGWLHYFESGNRGELMRTVWNDLNYPARMGTLAVAGVPMLQKDNTGHIVATQHLTQKLDVGVFFNTFTELSSILKDKRRMAQIRENVWLNRELFSFDYYTEELIKFFRTVIASKSLDKFLVT